MSSMLDLNAPVPIDVFNEDATVAKRTGDQNWSIEKRMLSVWILRIVRCEPCCVVFSLEMSYDEHTSYTESNKEALRKVKMYKINLQDISAV